MGVWPSRACAHGPDTEYGTSRGTSLTGLRSSPRCSATAATRCERRSGSPTSWPDWAEGIVRFAPYPGPPARDEAAWYRHWLAADPDRWLIYVVRDFDAESEYWKDVRDGLSESTEPDRRAEAEEKRVAAADWVARLPAKAKPAADPRRWFAVETAWDPPRVLHQAERSLGQGIDAAAAALPFTSRSGRTAGPVLLGATASRSCWTSRDRPADGSW